MENFDAEKARRIWNRVQGRAPQPVPEHSLSDILLMKTRTASLYQRLSRYFGGRTGAVLQNFYRQEKEHITALNRLGFTAQSSPPPKEQAKALIQQCYRLKLRLLSAYEGYAGTPFGGVLEQFIPEEQAQCRFLLKLMQPRKFR